MKKGKFVDKSKRNNEKDEGEMENDFWGTKE